MLEECGLPYKLNLINIREGEQKKPEYLKINPNGRIPALLDNENSMRVFESGAMLIYLAEKSGKFFPKEKTERAEVLGWTFWQAGGLGPMLGQYSHFNGLEEDIPYATARYKDESVRLLSVLNEHLKHHDYLGGDEYSIADIMNYSWAVMGMNSLTDKYPEDVRGFDSLRSWLTRIGERPAVQKGVEILADTSQSKY